MTDYVQVITGYPNSLLKFDRDKECFHPAQKPKLLNQHLILTYSNPSDLILDSCIGAGSILIAAKNTLQNYVGIEKEQKYYSIITERLI